MESLLLVHLFFFYQLVLWLSSSSPLFQLSIASSSSSFTFLPLLLLILSPPKVPSHFIDLSRYVSSLNHSFATLRVSWTVSLHDDIGDPPLPQIQTQPSSPLPSFDKTLVSSSSSSFFIKGIENSLYNFCTKWLIDQYCKIWILMWAFNSIFLFTWVSPNLCALFTLPPLRLIFR